MSCVIRYRDSKGRWARFNPNKILTKEVRKTIPGSRKLPLIGAQRKRHRSKEGYTGIKLFSQNNLRLNQKDRPFYHHGEVWLKGVKIFNLKSLDTLTKNKKKDIDDYLSSLCDKRTQDFGSKDDIQDFIDELYEYKDTKGRGLDNEQNRPLELG